MNQIVFAAGVLLFPAVCTTLGAAGVFLLCRSAAPRTQRVLSGMAVRKRKQKNSVQVLQIPKIVVPLQRN